MAGIDKLMRFPKVVIAVMSTWLLLITCVPATFGQEPVGNSMTFVVPFPGNSYPVIRMVIYVCTGARPANITATTYTENTATTQVYHINANSALEIPLKDQDIAMLEPGNPPQREISIRRSMRIHSDMPVSAYAHWYGFYASGSTTLIPVRNWGYNYKIMDVPYNRRGSVVVTAAYDNTLVEITPTQRTSADNVAGRPFTMVMNKGETYQLYLPTRSNAPSRELTGTTIKVLPNSYGVRYPVGAFISSAIIVVSNAAAAAPEGSGGTADFEVEQLPDLCRWGRRYLTTPFATPAPKNNNRNASEWAFFRVMVDNPATVVMKNGVALTPLIDGRYYEYISNTADYLDADGPVMVTQYMFTEHEKTYTVAQGGDGDALKLSPLDDTCTRADFYLPDKGILQYTYVSLSVPTYALGSLTINGNSDFYTTYPHPNMPGYTVVVKKWDPVAAYCTIRCDAAFTAICYSGGIRDAGNEETAESCSFDISPVAYAEGDAMLSRRNDNNLMKSSACMNDSFRLVLKTEILPEKMEWQLKDYPGLYPNDQNVTVLNPVPDSTVAKEGHIYRYFSLPKYYTLTKAGAYAIPVTVTAPTIRTCSQSQTFIAALTALVLPAADFSYTSSGCLPLDVKFTGGVVTGDTSVITAWKWDFGDQQFTTSTASYTYNTTGEKSIYLHVTARNGCVDDTVKLVTLKEAVKPIPAFQLPGVLCVPNDTAKFINKTIYTGTAPNGLTWNWNFGDLSAASAAKDPGHLYKTVGSYTVKLVATASDGCRDSISQELKSLINGPTAAFDPSATILCTGERLVLTDRSIPAPGSTITKWNWQFGDGSSAAVQHAEKRYSRPGTPFKIIQLVTSPNGCSDTATANITVYDVPRVEAGPDRVVLQGNTVQLQGTVTVAGSAVIKWSPSTWLSADNVTTPYVSPQADQLYYLTVSSGQCSAYDSVRVKVLPELVMPNAFSPNGDGNHDIWDIPGLNTYPAAIVQVFNRYGQKVFESKGYTVAWDGTFQGKLLPSGTYYYVIHPGEGKPAQTGPVTILH
jgi:gliding motility-associated-like protein